jgi:hypothetical protein
MKIIISLDITSCNRYKFNVLNEGAASIFRVKDAKDQQEAYGKQSHQTIILLIVSALRTSN